MNDFAIGDVVRCQYPGSWVDGKTGTIKALDVVASDGIQGHLLSVPGIGSTVVEPCCLARHLGEPASEPSSG